MLKPIFEPFIAESPLSVMARATIERALNPKKLDEWFDSTAKAQYTRELMFSSVFGLMCQVVSGRHPSVNAAYQASRKKIGVSVASVYNKLNNIETNTSAELVRYAAGQTAPIIKELGGIEAALLNGYRVKMLDGNCRRPGGRVLILDYPLPKLHIFAMMLAGDVTQVTDTVGRVDGT